MICYSTKGLWLKPERTVHWDSRIPVKVHDRHQKPGHTQPDPCLPEHGRSKCDLINIDATFVIPTGEQIFVAASYQTGLDTRSMTQRSIKVGISEGKGRAWVEARALLDYDAARPPEGEGLTASSLLLLDCAHGNGLADICHCLPPDRTWHKVNDLKVDYSGDLWEALLNYAGHQPTQCNVGLMNLAGLGPKYGFRHICLIIA